MGVFWLLTPAINAKGQNIGFPWEVPGCDSIDDLTIQLQDKGIVAGRRLDTVDDGRGGKMVRRRFPMALTVRGIASISPPLFRIWEPDEDRPPP